MSGYVRHIKQLTNPVASHLGEFDIELTERCNNDCIHCCINLPANDAKAMAHEMTTAQVRDILQQAADLGCLEVRFTGGEPLLRADFEEIYEFARRLGMAVLLFTNGRLMTPHLADLFVRIPLRAPIEITVYGMRRKSYEAVTRAPGSFLQFWRGVTLLLERGVPFVVKGVLLPPNRCEKDEFEAWAQTIPWMTSRPGYAMFFDLRSRRDDADKNRLIESLRLSPQDGLAVLTRNDAGFRKTMADFSSKFMGQPDDRLFSCGAGNSICVDAYGRAQPCLALRAPELTVNLIPSSDSACRRRIGGGRLSGALDTFSSLRDLRATNPEYLRRCAVCFLKGLCEQCPAKSWAEHGTLDVPVAYWCGIAHAQARHLGWLSEKEFGWEVADWRERVIRSWE